MWCENNQRHMRRLLIIVQIAALVLCIGCSSDEATMADIYHAEAIAEEYPDSALTIMRGIDVDKVRTERDMMRYRLVYSEVAYYGRMYVANDSLTKPLFDYYYANHESHDKRARAMYQHAHVKQNSGKHAEAMFALIEAEKSLAHIDNPRLAGLVHRTKGEIYGAECLFQNALEEYKLAQEHFEQANLTHHSVDIAVDVGSIYRSLKDFDQAKIYLTEAIEPCIEYQYKELLGYICTELALLYIEENDMDKCRDIITIYDTYDCIGGYELVYYYTYAIVAADGDKRDDAINYLNIAKSYPDDYYTDIHYLAHIVYKKLGLLDEALEHITISEKEQDSLMLMVLSNPILNYQIELLEREQVIAEKQARYNQVLLLSAIVILVLVVIAIVLYARYRYIKQSRSIAHYINVIAELRESIKSVDFSQQPTLQNSDDFAELNRLCEIYYQYGKTPHVSKKIADTVIKNIESLRSDEARLKSLENIINIRNNNILTEIVESCPKLNPKEYRYIVYLLLGFTSRSIAVLLEMDTEAISRLKYKVRMKLSESNCEIAKDIFSKNR